MKVTYSVLCVFAEFALAINMTRLLISAVIVCVVFAQEFGGKTNGTN